MTRALVLLLCVVLFAPMRGSAQSRADVATLLARADAAFARHDTAAARVSYDALLQLDPDHSRGIYQLARLQPAGSARAIRLFRRYTELEPQDAWGFLALGAACEEAGEREDARDAYTRAVALEPMSQEMRDARARMTQREERATSRVTFEPVARFSSDSDGNAAQRTGFAAAFGIGDSVTVGGVVSRLTVSDGFTRATAYEGALSADWRPNRALLLQARGGAARFPGDLASPDAVEPIAHVRLRWRPEHGPNVDVRVRREPLSATPQLLNGPVLIAETRALVELPLASALRVRGMTRYGSLRAPADVNERLTWSAGPVVRLGSDAELSASYARTTYARASAAGYFAPREANALDAGVYIEHYGWWPVTLVVDVGGGVERITPFTTESGAGRAGRGESAAGEWKRALRLWSQASWAFTRHGELRLEAEAYETQVGEAVAAAPTGWRWGSLALSALWRP